MEAPFRLNDTDVSANAAAWSHDPSMMYDGRTGLYYSYSTDVFHPECGLCEKKGIPVRSSLDLVHFKYEGTVLSAAAVRQAQDNGAFPDTEGFWAPYVEFFNGEYRLYYSATKCFGSCESKIWLAVSQSPLGPFENRGIVIDTWNAGGADIPNAIDPHVIHFGKKSYIVYGSFFGGIFIKELNSETGFSKDANPRAYGSRISRKPEGSQIDGPEGASVIFVPETGYFYLFQSYGWLGDTYDIRVGRSRSIIGPYTDYNGISLDGESLGLKIAGSYAFSASDPCVKKEGEWKWGGFRGPGHGVPFLDPVSGSYFFVHHVRDGAESNCTVDDKGRKTWNVHYLFIRPLFFINGWPVLGPEPFCGTVFPASIHETFFSSEEFWSHRNAMELIQFEYDDNSMRHSVKKVCNHLEQFAGQCILYECTDFENRGTAAVVTGIDGQGIAYWGKFVYRNSIIK